MHAGRRDLFGLFLLSFVASALVGTHGLAYWDAGDYTRLAIEGAPSGLLLGRPLFLAASRLILATGFDVAHAEPVLRWTWTFASATAPPLLALLAARLGFSRAEALATGAALALSPAFAHTAHQVLTDGPALALTIGALVIAAGQPTIDSEGESAGVPSARRPIARAATSGLVLAAAIATRETAVLFGLSLVLLALPAGRLAALAAATTTVVGTAAIVLIAHHGPPPSLVGWTAAMGKSSTLHLRDVLVSLGWVLAIGPLPVVLGIAALRSPRKELRWIAWPATLATLLLVFYPFGAYSPRYVLATAPLAFLLPAGPLLAKRPRLAIVLLLLPLGAVFFATRPTRALAERGADAATRFSTLPDRALLVPGHFCPQVRLAIAIDAKKTGLHRDVTLLCPGWEWPDDPADALDRARCEGRTLVLDLRDDAWFGDGERAPRAALQAWAARQSLTGPIAVVPPRECR